VLKTDYSGYGTESDPDQILLGGGMRSLTALVFVVIVAVWGYIASVPSGLGNDLERILSHRNIYERQWHT